MKFRSPLSKILAAAGAGIYTTIFSVSAIATSAADAPNALSLVKPGYSAGIRADVSAQLVVRETENEYSKELKIPITKWSQEAVAPRAVLVALHGCTLHGNTFDEFARQMVQRGYVVYAPDMRGFGRWLSEPESYPQGKEIEAYKDRADLIMLLSSLRNNQPSVPIYCIGESLGSNMSLWVASVHPDLIDGIIMSSPCIKRHLCLNRTMVVDFFKALRNPHRQLPTKNYASRYLSESKDVTAGYLADPGIRKTMSAYETFQSFHINKSCLTYVENIPADMPILVVEGTKDGMYAAKAVKPLLERIKSGDETVHFLPKRGHIHLETAHVQPDVVKTVDEWLRARIDISAARKRNTPSISANPE